MRKTLLVILGLCLVASGVCADDLDSKRSHNWHQWRGPSANGVAEHGDPPIAWDDRTNVKWKVKIPGEGSATPIVWDDQVFVLTAVETERRVDSLPPVKAEPPGGYKTKRPNSYYQFVVMSIDRQTGHVRWQDVANEEIPHEGRHGTNTYASGSPTTDGRYLYASFGSRGTYCYDLQGNQQWKRDLGDMITRMGWGEGTSPVVHGDSLVVNFDHDGDSFLEVLDAATGRTKWKVQRDELSSWSTPLVVERGDTVQVIVSATRRVKSYDLATGEILWECGGQTTNVIPSPVAAGDAVYCVSGYRGSAVYALPLDAAGDLTDTSKILWHYGRDTPYVPSPLLYGDLLFFTKSNSGRLTCLDTRTGEPLIEAAPLSALKSIYASPVGAAGRIYLVARDGTTQVIKCQGELEILATNQLDEPMDASPAVVGKQLFLRGKEHLYCIQTPDP